ncbi:MAG: cobalamin biosynthesis protein [Chloroflexi bacterium]|nr:cobalamin biosynthesis protein [Chloroflexota bacterium]
MTTPRQTQIAMLAVSRPGSELALRLQRQLPEATVFLPERYVPFSGADVKAWSGTASVLLPGMFARYDGLVIFGSVGMVVRLIAPLLVDKHTDPAVVVVDDAGRSAVSILSGHLGGANALARRVASLLGAQAVITTASEVLHTVAVDILGREFGWRIQSGAAVSRVSAALVNGERVGLWQDTGERGWWPEGRPLPPNLVCLAGLEQLPEARCQAILIITDRLLEQWAEGLPPSVIYRPRSLVVGLGCNRGATMEEIASAVHEGLAEAGLSRASIRKLATIDIKRDEAGLQAVARQWAVPIEYFSAEEMNGVSPMPNPSLTVRKWTGAQGVCEPAALLGSGAAALIVPKRKTANVTVAVARLDFERMAGE